MRHVIGIVLIVSMILFFGFSIYKTYERRVAMSQFTSDCEEGGDVVVIDLYHDNPMCFKQSVIRRMQGD